MLKSAGSRAPGGVRRAAMDARGPNGNNRPVIMSSSRADPADPPYPEPVPKF